MEPKKTTSSTTSTLPHEINLNNRTELKITGVFEVVSATTSAIIAKTSAGGLAITGENLKILNLNNHEKTIEIRGVVNEIKYNQKKKKFLEKVFR